jgi:ribosomal protein S18 acetylase RimI-like enzyme
MSNAATSILLRSASLNDAPFIAELVIFSGENLITHAFGGKRPEALLSIEALCRNHGTMFSYDRATVAVQAGAEERGPIGVVISHASTSERLTSRGLAELLGRERGWWQELKMLPVAIGLQACSEPVPPKRTYVSILAVHPDMRSQGIGARLLRFAETAATDSGDGTICLDVETNNPRAIAFYERMAYRAVSERTAPGYLQRKGISGMRRMEKAL